MSSLGNVQKIVKKGVILIDNTGKIDILKMIDNKNDEYDEELYDLIRAKITKKFYTYKELCATLNLKEVSGNSKPSQLKELSRYIDLDYNKKTKKYKIKEIYTTPLPRSSTSPANILYAKHVKVLLLSYILRKADNTGVTYVSSEQLYKALGMINGQYIESKQRGGKTILSNELKKELEINKGYNAEHLKDSTLTFYINDFYNRSKKKMYSIVDNVFKTLEKQRYIIYTKAYSLYWTNAYPTHSTDAETSDILEIEREVMDIFGFKEEKDIWFSGKTEAYWKQVLEFAQELYPELRGIYRCHKIIGTKNNLLKALEREEETSEMHELNKKILDSLDRQALRKMEESIKNNPKDPISNLPIDHSKQLSVRYLDAQYYLSDKLIKIKEVL